MLMEVSNLVDVVGKPLKRKVNVSLREDDEGLSFFFAVLVTLLYKYSSRWCDQVSLSVEVIKPVADPKIELNYSLSDNQDFYSVYQQVKTDLSVINQALSWQQIHLSITWKAEHESDHSLYRIRMSPSPGEDLCEVLFSCEPHSFFAIAFRQAARHYETLAAKAQKFPHAPISELSYLHQKDLNEIHSLACGPMDEHISAPEFLDHIFEQTVEQYPNMKAVVDGEVSITYLGLRKMVNHLAHLLSQNQVGPGDKVAILLNRSAEAYAALLATLKCGAAYVPIDMDYPQERIEYILKDSNAKCLISVRKFKDKYSSFGRKILHTDKLLADYHSQTVPEHVEQPRSHYDAAYMIYTSGSTGKPKGVVVSHAAASNLIKAERQLYKVKPADKVVQGFSIAFDASIEEIWLAFSTGATLLPAKKEIMRSGLDLCEFINNNSVTVLSTVPTLLSAMSPHLPSLKLLILGGEACPQELAQRWSRNGLRIVNTYGPTEATVISTAADVVEGRKITIGKPIYNYGVYIADAALHPVATGIPGELCIAGAGLANGYHNNDALTAAKFVDSPFHLHDGLGKKIYRSGDLARYNDEGNIEFLGRIDSQVKLRGYRIELSEIESRLWLLENVENAVVVLQQHGEEQKLVAYLVLKDKSKAIDQSSVREALLKQLPSFMIPSVFVEMDNIPVLANGKVDHKKLAEPKFDFSAEKKRIAAMRNKTEKKVFEVWSKYFSVPVSRSDDFFLDLGGHSMLAARVVSELRQQPDFQKLSVGDIYSFPTIEKLAAEIDKHRGARSQKTNHHHSVHESWKDKLRHAACGLFQFASMYFVFGINLIRDFTLFGVFFFLYSSDHSVAYSIGWAVPAFIGVYPALIIIAIVSKWILLGRIQPGRHPLWGAYYLRWWLVRKIFQLLDLYHIAGTPLLPVIYKALGMKVGNNVHLDTDRFAAFDVITIDDGASIDEEASISGFSIQDGFLNIGPVHIGKNCFVGTRCVIAEHAIMEDESRLEDLSLLKTGEKIPRGETWQGSPAKKTSRLNYNEIIRSPRMTAAKKMGVSLLYALLVCAVPLVSSLAFIPGVILLVQNDPINNFWFYLSLIPVVGLSFVLFVTSQVVILKWLLVGRVKPGLYPVHGNFYIRNWVVEQLLRTALDHVGQLHATLYVNSWYRALGMKIFSFVELSTASTGNPDLIQLQEGCTIADEVSLGTPHIEKGWMSIAPVSLGQRSFAGNSAVIPMGTHLGNHSLVGVLSIAPENEKGKAPGNTWFGSPPISFPKREDSKGFSEERTYRPSKSLRWKRAGFELLRVTLPPAFSIIVASSVINIGLLLWHNFGLLKTLLALPVVLGAACVLMALAVALIKWIVMGTYRPFNHPLWSNFVWRLEFVNAMYEFFAAPLVLELLQGTPFLPAYLRLLGVKFGKRCYLDTTGFLEWDLVSIGDRVALNENAVIQTHLFEDRVLKASALSIGNDCSIGISSVVLYDSKMEDNAQLNSLSLVMKGETLPENTRWSGIPASLDDSRVNSKYINELQVP